MNPTQLVSTHLIPALLIAGLAGCSRGLETVQSGEVLVCYGASAAGDDLDVEITGTLGEAGAGCEDSSVSFSVEAADGTVATFGLTVLDPSGADVTPDLAVDDGATVSVLYRYRLVWGDVAGIVVSDALGLVLAADEGGWGQALGDGDVAGLQVVRGDEVVVEEEAECEPIQGFELTFTGDDSVTLLPFEQSTIYLDGGIVQVSAIAAYDYGEGKNCATTDRSGRWSWMVHR